MKRQKLDLSLTQANTSFALRATARPQKRERSRHSEATADSAAFSREEHSVCFDSLILKASQQVGGTGRARTSGTKLRLSRGRRANLGSDGASPYPELRPTVILHCMEVGRFRSWN
jgi:hypothetical protein